MLIIGYVRGIKMTITDQPTSKILRKSDNKNCDHKYEFDDDHFFYYCENCSEIWEDLEITGDY